MRANRIHYRQFYAREDSVLMKSTKTDFAFILLACTHHEKRPQA
jgi:hypothetical protein